MIDNLSFLVIARNEVTKQSFLMFLIT